MTFAGPISLQARWVGPYGTSTHERSLSHGLVAGSSSRGPGAGRAIVPRPV